MQRRVFIKNTLLAAGAISMADTALTANTLGDTPLFQLPELGYSYGALEPHIDAKTMEIHHSKHHKTYVDNLNKAIKENKVEEKEIVALCKNISKYNMAVRNNAGGHYNHSFFWKLLKATDHSEPIGEMAAAIEKQFTNMAVFTNKIRATGNAHFGSGWVWVVVNDKKEIIIDSLPNQDNPLMNLPEQKLKGTPILAIDVWEHAYYLKHQNVRMKYLTGISSCIDWEYVNNLYVEAIK